MADGEGYERPAVVLQLLRLYTTSYVIEHDLPCLGVRDTRCLPLRVILPPHDVPRCMVLFAVSVRLRATNLSLPQGIAAGHVRSISV